MKAVNSRVIFLFKQSIVFVGGFGIVSDQVREAWVFFFRNYCVVMEGDPGLGISLQNTLLWPASLLLLDSVSYHLWLWVMGAWNATWSRFPCSLYREFLGEKG